jgi:16S rRNA (guanine527-N7)-methyltransferase
MSAEEERDTLAIEIDRNAFASKNLTLVQKTKAIQFFTELVKENRIQNLTRLTSPLDFVEGHLLDVVHLQQCGFLPDQGKVLDLGCGGGVPGLLSSVIDQRKWTLVDSEKSKVDFLERTANLLSNFPVEAIAGRIEQVLRTDKKEFPEIIVSRAVGPVLRLYNWIRNGRDWRQLVLLKGKSWEDEWAKFNASQYAGELVIVDKYEYVVGEEAKRRIIVKLERVQGKGKRKGVVSRSYHHKKFKSTTS